MVENEYKTVRIFVLSSHDRNGLHRQRESLAVYLQSRRIEGYHAQNQMLRNLAFTLSDKRSKLTWRTYASASSIVQLLSTLHTSDSDLPAFRPSTTPRVGFIFTGQGAQWPRMGVELNQYLVFRQSIEKSDEYLSSSLGCTWSASKELSIAEGHSQMNNPAFAQPLCTILQIALVDLLESWNIHPSAVVGHSSGEIAAAYCLGALSREDALKAAFCRGLLAARMKELAPSVKGAMLAVGASESQAQDWIDELDTASGQVSVACVNSPSSVTLSGDLSAIEGLQELLKQKGVFARKLKVETAYHSPHMNVISMLYLESLSSIQTMSAHESRRMYSAVTGTAVEASELGPMNWVRNLVSPVLFYDALHEMLRPQGGTASVDILLELGPHSTLQGAVDQTMAKHNIHNVAYLPMLKRGQNAAETGLDSVAALFARGVPVNLNQVNMGAEDAAVEAPVPLVNLPSYAWNHSRTFWAETRVSKEYRSRKRPRLSLLGAPYPKLSGSTRLWKGQIRIAEQPWIRDHKIQTSILYPAAGYLAMAIEAAAQIATEGQTIKEFRLRDVQIVAPAVMSEDSDLECILEIRPHRTGNRDASSTWLEFSISSCHHGEDLRENCFGLFQTRYQPIGDSSMLLEDNWEHDKAIIQYHESDKICDVSEDTTQFYEELASIGLIYGRTFQNLIDCRRAPGRSFFTISMLNPELDFTAESAKRPHIIHPTNLDSIFHGVFAALKGLKGHLKDNMVPTSIEEIAISADVPFKSGSVSKGFCTASEHGFRDLMADLTMFDEDLTYPTIAIKGFHCSQVSGAGANAMDIMDRTKANIFSKMVWKPAARFLMPAQVQQLISPTTPRALSISSTYRRERYESQVLHHIQCALKETSIDQVLTVGLRDLYVWMEKQDQLAKSNAQSMHDIDQQSSESSGSRAETTEKEDEKESVESEIIDRIGSNITAILNGAIDVEHLLLEDGLVDRWSSELSGLDECLEKLGKVSPTFRIDFEDKVYSFFLVYRAVGISGADDLNPGDWKLCRRRPIHHSCQLQNLEDFSYFLPLRSVKIYRCGSKQSEGISR